MRWPEKDTAASADHECSRKQNAGGFKMNSKNIWLEPFWNGCYGTKDRKGRILIANWPKGQCINYENELHIQKWDYDLRIKNRN